MATGNQNILDKNFTAFEFNINHVQFNHQGRYFLRLSVCSSFSTKDYSQIKVRRNKARSYENARVTNTDTVVQEELKTNVKFKDYRFTFFLPKGFCKNDKNHDVYLQIEAFAVEEGEDETSAKKVGEANFAIYPRTNHPKVNVYADIEENMFRKEDVISLFRTASTDNVKMHCGRLKYSASFRKVRKMPQDYEIEAPADTPIVSTEVTPTPSKTDGPSPPPDMMGDAALVLPPAPDTDPDYGHRKAVDQDILADSYTAFEFDVYHGQFNYVGDYFVRLTLCCTDPKADVSGIIVRKNKGPNELTRELKTDTLSQAELRRSYKFQDNRFTYFLPKGLCKNEKNYSVYLQIDAYAVGEGSEPTQVGDAQYHIYPRRVHPKVNVHTDLEENMFRIEDVINLFNIVNADNTKLHIGRLKYRAKYRKIRKMPEEKEEVVEEETVDEDESESESSSEEQEVAEDDVEAEEVVDVHAAIPQKLEELQESDMAFEFDFYNAQYNVPGDYFLQLTVCSSSDGKAYNEILVDQNNQEIYVRSHEATTSNAYQDEPMADTKYNDHQWTFFLPKGFCNNKKEDDAYLKIEAFAVHENQMEASKVGEARLDIYPQTDPRMKASMTLNPGVDEDMFSTDDVIDLVSRSDTDDTETLCGRLNYIARLRKIPEMPEETPEPIPDENLAFDFQISNAQFISPGGYTVHFAVCNEKENKKFQDIKIEKNGDGNYLTAYEGQSDELLQEEPGATMDCTGQTWTLYIPRGFIGNEKDDGAHLQIEAFMNSDDDTGPKKVGEARHDIYPRRNVPVNVNTDYEEPMYNTEEMVPLVSPLNMNMSHSINAELLSGQISCISSLRKIDDMPNNEPPIPVPDENMAFHFDFYNSQFTEPGHYLLHLAVCSSLPDKDFSGIKVEKNDDGKYEDTHEVEAEVIMQDEPNSDVKHRENWTFYLPKGFISDDPEDDAFLKIEAFTIEEGKDESEPQKVGEGRFDIFPRTNPKPDVDAEMGEDMYSTDDVINMVQDDGETTCGKLNFVSSLQKIPEMPENKEQAPAIDDHLALDFHLSSARFDSEGKYILHIAVCNTAKDKDYSGIKLEENDDGNYQDKHEVDSDILVQDEHLSHYINTDQKWTFYIPKGFIDTDNNERAYLAVEARAIDEDNEDSEPKKHGEARFDIYPRKNPEAYVDAEVEEPMYVTEDEIDLLDDDKTTKGQLNCIGSLRKIDRFPGEEEALQQQLLDENSLVFEFTILSAVFNRKGRYHLQLSMCSNSKKTDYGLIKVKNQDEDYGLLPEVKTERVSVEPDVDFNFKNHKWIFILPKGFYTDAYLKIDCYAAEDNSNKSPGKKVATAQFPLASCTKESIHDPNSDQIDHILRKVGVIKVLGLDDDDELGQLNFGANIHKLGDIPDDDDEEETFVDDSTFAIELTINTAEFDELGRYNLRLAVCSSFMPADYSLIKVQSNKVLSYALTKEVKTETIAQTEEGTCVELKRKKWTFILPKGFCKPDEKSDVYLQIDAYSVDEEMNQSKVGTAQFVVTPCTDPTAYAQSSNTDAVFKKKGVMTIFKSESGRTTEARCGILNYDVTVLKLTEVPEDYGQLARELSTSIQAVSQVTQYYMALEFVINQVKFNREGQYFVRVRVCSNSGPREYSIIKVQKHVDGREQTREVKTETVALDKEAEVKFVDRKWTFILPKGCCEDDASRDVYLKIDAVQEGNEKYVSGKKVARGQYVIYPSPDHPNLTQCMKIRIFRESGVIDMAQLKKEDGPTFGHVNYTATFRRIRMTQEDYEKLYPPKVPERSSQKLADNARLWGREKSDMAVKLQEAELGLRRSPMATDYNPKLAPGWAMLPKVNSQPFSKAPLQKSSHARDYRRSPVPDPM